MQKFHGERALIDKETVLIPISGRIHQEAYHAAVLSSNITAAYLLSENFEVVTFSSIREKRLLTLQERLLPRGISHLEVSLFEGLYKIQINPEFSVSA